VDVDQPTGALALLPHLGLAGLTASLFALTSAAAVALRRQFRRVTASAETELALARPFLPLHPTLAGGAVTPAIFHIPREAPATPWVEAEVKADVYPAVFNVAPQRGPKKYKVGVVGSSGAVGVEILGVLAQRGFPVEELHAFASARSAGKVINTGFGDVTVEEFTLEGARAMDVVFLAVDGDFAAAWAEKIIADGGPYVIDNSSHFRYREDIPLVVPEVNGEECSKGKLIANPNCTTAIALMALYPLHKEFTVKRMIMSTYQAASGAGAPGMNELEDGVKKFAAGEEIKGTNKVFAHPLPFNVIPHIDKFQENMYTKEEMKVTWETRKIMNVPDLPASCTAVRIPTLRAHAEAITIETEKPCPPERAREILASAPGVVLKDDPENQVYPMPMNASTNYDVEVGRIRRCEAFGDNGLDFFVCGDQLLRGAALNAVLVAERALEIPEPA
jgi:aspartate-semialdehyde dehydrogenase